MKKTTAVEWLVDQYIQGNYMIDVFYQAKEMEKQQIEDAYKDGNYDNGMSRCEPEQYYNDTYKK